MSQNAIIRDFDVLEDTCTSFSLICVDALVHKFLL